VNINRSSTGRLNSLTDGAGANYLSGIGYNAAGQVTGLTLGNGVAETYGYDTNRMQLTSQTATKSGGPQNGLMNLSYNYQASAGQMGGGTTTGNAGQLMSISGTINSTTESAAYTYDNVGRLVTSNQTSNGSSAQRRFAYDRWGNRTGMWDATSGGNQLQSAVLQQSGGAPTNQLQSVTTSGVTKNYSYDATGNVTNDGVHSHTYDGENRLVSVDGGVTAQYAYDQNNRRYKKTVGSTVTYYVWEGSQVVSEHDGTGTPLAEYIYSRNQMIAKSVDGAIHYLLSDRLSARLVLDTSGNVVGRMAHLPFGEDFGESGTQEKHHFTNYERDSETSSDYAVNRQDAPGVGRFMRVDPLCGLTANPQGLNRFSYSVNDPVNTVDPLGLDWECVCGHLPKEESATSSGDLECDCIWVDPPQHDSGRPKGISRYAFCRNKVFGSANAAGVLPIPNEHATNSILEHSHNNADAAAMMAALWGKESQFMRRPTGDAGPAQLTSWWWTNHPELILPGAFDVPDPTNGRNADERFGGSVSANLETLYNIVVFSYDRYGNWRDAAFWYGPGTEKEPRPKYARQVMGAFGKFQDFFKCMTED
jgi:RHS repeat-associated protein